LVSFFQIVGSPQAVTVKTDADGNKRAYLSSAVSGLSVINVNTPSAPETEGNSDTLFSGDNIAASGALAVITNKIQKKLWVADISEPASPAVVGEFAMSQSTYDVALHTKQSTTDITMAVVAAGLSGIQVIDLSTPAYPAVIGTYNTPGNAYAVALNSAGTIAYVADGTGLRIVSLSNPSAPSLLGNLNISFGVWIDVAVSGNIVCMANQQGGLGVIDVTIPSAPTFPGYVLTLGYCLKVAMDSNDPTTVGVVSSGGVSDQLEIWDISIPSKPVRDGSVEICSSGNAKGLYLTGGVAYAAAANEGLKMFNIAPYPSLKYLPIAVPGNADAVAVKSPYAYTTGFPAAVSVIGLFAQ
jgi:hypothetical protein